jgi:hypothetical protein
MSADFSSLLKGMLPNNPKLANVLINVIKDSYRVRYLPRTMIRLLINRGLEEVRKNGTEILKEPIFVEVMTRHANSFRGRFASEIGQLNQAGGKR